MTVSPAPQTLLLGKSQQFTATVTNAGNTNVTWSVSGGAGSNASVGTISSSGLYTAPAILPSPVQVTIRATSAADPLATGTATVTIASDVTASVTPATPNVELGAALQFTATVSSPGGGSPDTAVNWSESGNGCTGAACGTISASGLYTAPSILPQTPGADVAVTATSVADPSKSASQTVHIKSNFTISISGPNTVDKTTTAQFTATITPVPNSSPSTSVNWSVNPGPGGSCTGAGTAAGQCGSIDTQGNYTAPQSALPPGNQVNISAQSIADASKSATQTIALGPIANVVIILTDDQRFDLAPHMTLTSALLSSETVRFDNAFVTTPDCCPSRASILTGLYSHNTGVLQDYNQSGGAISFNPSSTIATWLHDAGYRTGIFGKYLNGYYLLSPAVPPGWSEFHVFVRQNGVNSDGDFYYNYEFNDNGVVSSYGATAQDYSTSVITVKALQFLASTPPNQPLFLYFTPFGPHYPATPDAQDVGSSASFSDWRPPSFNEADVTDKPAWVQALPLLTATQIASSDAFHRSQLETLQSVDRAVASLITELQQDGRWNNTLLIFMSDNGLIWGEHRIQDTKFSAYDESVRVPLWVRAPGAVARQESGIAANIDLAPTIAEWVGVVPPSRVNGRSLIPLLNDPSAPWRGEILLEYLGPSINSYLRYRAVRTPQYLYVEYLSGERELYDLSLDPYELNNVANDSAYATAVSALRSLLAALKAS